MILLTKGSRPPPTTLVTEPSIRETVFTVELSLSATNNLSGIRVWLYVMPEGWANPALNLYLFARFSSFPDPAKGRQSSFLKHKIQ